MSPRCGWISSADKAVLVEFWDFCRVNSLRTLPYLKAWHERYADDGLRIVGVHTGGFLPARDEDNVRRAVERLEIPWPVAIDTELEVWDIYGNEGWPARYLWDRRPRRCTRCTTAKAPTSRPSSRSRRCWASTRDPLAPVRPEDAEDALIAAADRGPAGRLLRPVRGGRRVGGRRGRRRACASTARAVAVTEPGCFALIEHPRHTAGELSSRSARA